ncbi:FAD-dependent oxidoreductase [Candidatus Daviesbacteria bacterium]|nr:FAD-dependent oxidoreductase [Candidatus Daviesbacteria bacterium]
MDQMPQIFDTIVIGAGPAGITAAIYAVRKNLKVLVLTKDIGGQAALSGDIENYPGFSVITGSDLAKQFRIELVNFESKGLWIKEGVEVISLSGADPDFVVKTSEGREYHSKTVIIASGRIPKMLNIPGEKRLYGKGVTTCRACEAPFYKDKDVAIVGGGNSALDAAFSLQKVARSITIINITESLRGDEILLKNVTSSPKVKVLNNHEAIEILGDQAVGGIKIRNTQNNEEQVIPISGVFVEIGWSPSTTFDKLTDKNEKGEIEVDAFGATSVPGIYACGDVNNIWGEQIVIAAGEGSKTALRVAEHIAKVPHQVTSNIHEG